MIKVLIADDHHIVVDGLKSLLTYEDQISVVGEAKDGKEILRRLEEVSAKVLILDMEMPEMHGLDVIKIVKESHPNTRILVLSMNNEPAIINKAIELGVDGYLLKTSVSKDLVYAIHELAKGEIYFSDEVLKINLKSQRKRPILEKIKLTNREIDVLKKIAEDHTTGEISLLLDIAESTVETHRRNLIKKTGVSSSLGLVRYAIENGFLKDD